MIGTGTEAVTKANAADRKEVSIEAGRDTSVKSNDSVSP